MTCVIPANFVFIINDYPTTFLKAYRGGHQGCSLSPILFLLFMEALSRRIYEFRDRGHIWPLGWLDKFEFLIWYLSTIFSLVERLLSWNGPAFIISSQTLVRHPDLIWISTKHNRSPLIKMKTWIWIFVNFLDLHLGPWTLVLFIYVSTLSLINI